MEQIYSHMRPLRYEYMPLIYRATIQLCARVVYVIAHVIAHVKSIVKAPCLCQGYRLSD